MVTGLGTINPLGHDVATTWEGLVAGRSGIDYITLFDPSPYQTRFAGEVKGFDAQALLGRKEARRLDRFAQFAMVAARQAIADAGLTEDTIPPERIGVVFGSGVGGIGTIMDQHQVLLKRGPRRISPFFIPMMLADTAPAQIAITYGFRGPNMVVTTACASGTNAVGEAMELIRRGAADVVVAGGAEAAIVP
ncbi:MAG: beta-ketoacyl-[acyl-carrier-protein] synthase II, partial [Chloroflexi bacterium]